MGRAGREKPQVVGGAAAATATGAAATMVVVLVAEVAALVAAVAAVAAAATGAGTEIVATAAVLFGSIPRSVWVLQSRLPVLE